VRQAAPIGFAWAMESLWCASLAWIRDAARSGAWIGASRFRLWRCRSAWSRIPIRAPGATGGP